MKQALLLTLLFFNLTAIAQNYNARWEKVFDLESQGEYKKAAAAANAIYATAKKTHNDSQLVKALFFKSKYIMLHQEDGQYKVITALLEHIKTTPPATSALLQSIYAEMLYKILQDRRYNLKNRTAIAGPAPADYREWSATDYENAILQAYQGSLKNKELLYKTPLSAYDDVIDFSMVQSKINRPLYDFLAERYMDYVQGAATLASKQFTEKDLPLLYGDTDDFLKLDLTDTLKNLRPTLQLSREIEQHYLKTGNMPALQMAVLRRINYSPNYYHTKIIINGLNHLITKWGESPFTYRAMYMLAQNYSQIASKKDYPDYNNKALALLETLLKNTSKHDAGSEAVNLKNNILHQKFRMQTERFLVPGKPALATVSFRNLDSVELSFYKIKHGSIPANTNYIQLEILPQTQPFLKKTYTLPDPHNHFDYSTEIILPALEKGSYLITAKPINKTGDNPVTQKFYNSVIQVSQLSVLSQTVNNTIVYQLSDRETGAPIKNVVAIAVKKFISDANGTITVLKKPEKNGYQDITFYHEGDTLTDNFYNYRYGSDENPSASAQLYLDRAIYRPGQTMFFKGILSQGFKGKWSTVPNVFVSITVKNDDRAEIATFRLQTNEFGSFSGEFILPLSQTGSFSITVDEDEDMEKDPAYDVKKDEHPFWDNVDFNESSLDFRVEEYKRPTFEITWEPVREAYKFGDSITVTGRAVSYSGAPISGAVVHYEVSKSYGYNHYYNNNYDSYDKDNNNGRVIDEDKITTDALGSFKITFEAKEDSDDKGSHSIYTYNISADVKDINGETRTGSFSVRASNYPLELSASLPGVIMADETATVTISSKNINGQFLAAKGTVAIYKMSASGKVLKARPWNAPEIQTIPRAEFEHLYPYIPYNDVKDSVITTKAWYREDIDTAARTQLTLKNFKGWPSGAYQLVYTAKDASGFEEKTTTNFRLERKEEKTPANGGLLLSGS